MKALLDELKDCGCKIDEAMERFLDDEELYVECLEQMLDDTAFAELGTALENGDIESAFDKAHTLKGIIANMSLTSLYDIVVEIVEPLRHKESCDLMPIYKRLLAENQKYKDILAKHKAKA